jgi:putative oxygen-independent coproporphyrinogen III oxidase
MAVPRPTYGSRLSRQGWVTMAFGFGVYVHIPFCAKRCDYCAFATWTDRSHLVGRYLAAVRTEIERALVLPDGQAMTAATSVFFGGGTPSLVPAGDLMAVLDAIPRGPWAEVTVECNPDTITADLLETYRAHGVTRISLGVQSMLPHVLTSLGRTHDVGNVERAVALVRAAGFASYNLDLIYGGAGESIADWEATVRAALTLEPPHVSAYALTVEAGTPLALDSARHPDDDDQAEKYAVVDSMLAEAGLANYEISNWAKPNYECHHNLLYWAQGDYLGFGCAAHSHRAGRRWWNVRTPDRYLDLIESGRSAEAAFEHLDVDARRLEGLQLALRTSRGVPAGALSPDELDRLDGLVVLEGDRAVLTRSGRLLGNEVASRLS